MLTKKITLDADWKTFTGQFLCAGDEVKVEHKNGMLVEGTFQRRMPKNFSILIDGQNWKVHPSFIKECRKGDPNKLPEKEKSAVECNPAGLADCKVGDLALFYRGGQSFDVVKLIEISPRLRCKMVCKNNGKIYGYNAAWFVQKLDKNWLS